MGWPFLAEGGHPEPRSGDKARQIIPARPKTREPLREALSMPRQPVALKGDVKLGEQQFAVLPGVLRNAAVVAKTDAALHELYR